MVFEGVRGECGRYRLCVRGESLRCRVVLLIYFLFIFIHFGRRRLDLLKNVCHSPPRVKSSKSSRNKSPGLSNAYLGPLSKSVSKDALLKRSMWFAWQTYVYNHSCYRVCYGYFNFRLYFFVKIVYFSGLKLEYCVATNHIFVLVERYISASRYHTTLFKEPYHPF